MGFSRLQRWEAFPFLGEERRGEERRGEERRGEERRGEERRGEERRGEERRGEERRGEERRGEERRGEERRGEERRGERGSKQPNACSYKIHCFNSTVVKQWAKSSHSMEASKAYPIYKDVTEPLLTHTGVITANLTHIQMGASFTHRKPEYAASTGVPCSLLEEHISIDAPAKLEFNKARWKVLHLGWGSPKHRYRLGRERSEGSSGEKDLGVLVDERLDMSWQCVFATQKDNPILGYTKSGTSRSREGTLPLYSALLRDLECCVQLWGSQHKKDVDLLEQVHRTVPSMIKGLEHLCYEDRVGELGCSSWRRKSFRGTLQHFPMPKGAPKELKRDFAGTRAWSGKTRGNGFKLKDGGFKLDINEKFFAMRVVGHWHRVPREAMAAPSLEVLKARLDGALSNLVGWNVSLPTARVEGDGL
ncbi:hypothetical protein DUI87_29239 [Hirundo rustica rustica]|uniref:Uncharacterized protein n=1 Tax=Hirundo rustica rustica TaxID=333673 RepID=A0A3M0J0S8_HIRRU|nr:hypothetical protein DUI87_29239 [Hirundo rustica rustica]